MNENKRREWVKNAIIVFLIIMLLLTFFSNTIMNYSLPQISAKRVESGTVSEQIRGSGTVAANQSYEVKMGETRRIASVEVKVGDVIEKGQTLMKLEDRESSEMSAAEGELKEAQKALRAAKKSYAEALLSVGYDYSTEELEIENQETAIAEMKAELPRISGYQKAYDNAKAKTRDVQTEVRELEREVKDRENTVAAALDEKKYSELSAEDYRKITAASNIYQEAEKEKAEIEENIKKYQENIGSGSDQSSINSLSKAIEEKHLEMNRLNDKLYAEYMSEEPDNDKISEIQSQLTQCALDLKYLEADYYEVIAKSDTSAANKMLLENEQAALKAKEQECENAKKVLDDVVKEIKKAAEKKLRESEDKLEAAKLRLEDANTAEAEAKAKLSVTKEEQEAKIREAETALAKAKIALSQKQKQDAVDAGKSALGIQALQDGVSDAEEKVTEANEKIAELKAESIGGEVTAPVGGKILSLAYAAGEEAAKESVAAVIEMSEKGYTLSITVTAEQARKVKVGDAAEVQYYWGGDLDVKLASIASDEKNPAKSKILKFAVTGDITPGQDLQITMGSKGQRYDYIVPNSAIREDNNGKFVLAAVSKSSPLGNRYIAQRIDIEVLASDDTTSAVSGDFLGGEFVISASTKPVNPGEQVRFAEN